jgi:ribonuclease P protein component
MQTTDRPKGNNSQRLRKDRRIRKRRDFLRIQRSGTRVHGSLIVLIAKRISPNSRGRVGLTVAKTVGKAHVRNLVKRRLRHIIRENAVLLSSCDVVILALADAATASFDALKSDLLRTFDLLLKKMAAAGNRSVRPAAKHTQNPETKS